MTDYNPDEYTFIGLDNHGKASSGPTTLAYLVGLVDSSNHEMADIKKAKSILRLLFEVEEQQPDASALLGRQQHFLSKNYFSQTPCMLTKAWSPIGAMLEQGFGPVVLKREPKHRATTTGIWEPFSFRSANNIHDSETVEQLFWAILSEAFHRARERKMYVNIIAKPGWAYEAGISSLPKWNKVEITKADRILWKRTPECP